jgi:hypothetical protein
MKRFLTAIAIYAAVSVFSLTAFGQSPMLPPPGGDFPDSVSPGLRGDQTARRWGPEVHREPRVIKTGPLAPAPDDRIAFKSFLEEKNTGLIRLLPRQVVDRGVFIADRKLNLRGGGAYFSFAHLTHSYGYGSDIQLERDQLSVGFAGADYGMMTNIGDVPLEHITPDDVRTQQIASYRPPRPESEARAEYRRTSSHEGMSFDGLIYRKQLPVQENSTYLLRSISYKSGDRGTDVLVAFRLVRKDTDGSVIIAWKLLKRYSAPELDREK